MTEGTQPRMARLIGTFAFIVGIAIAAALPGAVIWAESQGIESSAVAEIEGHVHAVQRLVAADPEFWHFKTQELESILGDGARGKDRRFSVIDANGRPILNMDVGTPPAWPLARFSGTLYDSGKPAGTVEMLVSLRQAWVHAAFALVLGILLAVAVSYTLRILPMRVLNLTLDDLRRERELVEKHALELEETNAALQLSEERVKDQLQYTYQLLESIPNPVVVTEPDGSYSFVNKAWEEYFGYGRASALGKKTMPWMPQDISFDGTQLNEQLISGKVRRAVRERRVVLADGVTREWIYQRSLLTRADGTPAGTIGTITDIAERKRAEAEMKRLSDEALEAARAKSAFLATMSHEIRTPMNGVIGMAEVLANTSLTREQRDSVDTIRKSGETLLAIINDILDYSKVESGNIELEKRDVEVHVLIEDIFELFAVTARSRAIDLLYLIDSNVPRTVVGDETRLRQVLSNLVGNALKFTKQGSVTIEVKGRREGAEFLLEVEVRDTGIGIPAERLDRLFKPFSQVDASTTREYGGTGLGLAICQRLVQLMGGDIRVESTPGKGSNFVFTARVGEAAATAKRYVAQDETQLRGRDALLVDDNPVNLRILRSQCENWGMRVWTAESAEDALRLVDERHFDIGVLDIHMPGVNGFELAARIRATERGVRLPMIALSSAPGDATDADRANFKSFLRKPVRQSALFTTLAGAVSKAGAAPASGESRAGAPQRREAAPLPSAGGKGRILLVEDNEINQGVAASLLGFLGYEVELAENGQLACEAAASKNYDLILMDVQMPVMDGLEATRRIISNAGSNPRPRIVAMTANAMIEDRERCAEAGMEDYLAKPFKLADLRAVLERNMPVKAAKGPTQEPTREHDSPVAGDDQTIEEERLDELAKLTSTDRVGKLIEAFDRNGADYLKAMREAPDLAQFRQHAHALKGMSLTLGARRLGELCERWQNIGDDCGVKTLEEAVTGMENEFRLAGDALRKYRAWRENPSSRALN